MTRGARARNLKGLAAELGAPMLVGTGRAFEAVRIARDSRYRVGRDGEGNPAILIETTGVAGAAALPDFEGRHPPDQPRGELRHQRGWYRGCAWAILGREVRRSR